MAFWDGCVHTHTSADCVIFHVRVSITMQCLVRAASHIACKATRDSCVNTGRQYYLLFITDSSFL